MVLLGISLNQELFWSLAFQNRRERELGIPEHTADTRDRTAVQRRQVRETVS